MALFVLHSSQVAESDGPPTVHGGTPLIFWPWHLAETQLQPISDWYRLSLACSPT